MTKLSLAELQPNDLVRVSRVARVVKVGDDWYGPEPYAVLTDEKNGNPFEVYSEDGNQKIELLHRPQKKPAVGDVLTPAEVKKTRWKRGSVIQNTTSGSIITLMPDGTWVNSSRGYIDITFSELDVIAQVFPKDRFRVIHVVK